VFSLPEALSAAARPPTVAPMSRLGLTPDELLLATWSAARPPAYAARLDGLTLLQGEMLALVGSGTLTVLEELAAALTRSMGRCAWIDGPVAAAGGVVRVHVQQAARVGVGAVAITGPFDADGLPAEARSLAVADLAGLGDLGVTAIVEVADVATAALFADRVAVVADGRPVVAYPVLAPRPRRAADVVTVTDRVRARLAACA
jgi:hypothetical protein